MPKPVRFKANSVVYFSGDVDDRIYILKSGRIVLRSRDIETGQELTDLIQTGEFFGVKSALGHFPREEDAMVLSDADVVQFTVPEFESL
ncbi:MAG: Crp/Fnr family transcriptional regulator, partial [Alkalispirochaeta sp.]